MKITKSEDSIPCFGKHPFFMKRIKAFIPIHLVLQHIWTCNFIKTVHLIKNESYNYG